MKKITGILIIIFLMGVFSCKTDKKSPKVNSVRESSKVSNVNDTNLADEEAKNDLNSSDPIILDEIETDTALQLFVIDSNVRVLEMDEELVLTPTWLIDGNTSFLEMKNVKADHNWFGDQDFSYLEIKDLMIHEGDIEIGKHGKLYTPKRPNKTKIHSTEMIKEKYGKRNSHANIGVNPGNSKVSALAAASNNAVEGDENDSEHNTYLWPYGLVPYTFNSNISTFGKNQIKKAIEVLDSKTTLSFFERNSEESYIEFRLDSSISGSGRSAVGRQSGKQIVKFKNNSIKESTVIHEVLHALGFFHEQSRSDRHFYVDVIEENIIDGLEHNFDQKNESESINLTAYDVTSIMHYSSRAFAKDELNTILNKDGSTISRNEELSFLDIKGINALYKQEAAGNLDPPVDTDSYRQVKLTFRDVGYIKGENNASFSTLPCSANLDIRPGKGWKHSDMPKPRWHRKNISHNTYSKSFPSRTQAQHHSSDLKWNVSVIIPPGERYVQAYFDFNMNLVPGIPSINLDANPIVSMKGVYLIIDTESQEVWLANKNRKKEACLGFVGSYFDSLQGFSSSELINVRSRFKISITAKSRSKVKSNGYN